VSAAHHSCMRMLPHACMPPTSSTLHPPSLQLPHKHTHTHTYTRTRTHTHTHTHAGSVSFAVLFTCGFPHAKKYSDPHDVTNAAATLARLLPRGTPVVGCAVAGLMGIDALGLPMEIDPSARGARGVTLLLGHLPNPATVRVFADTQLSPAQQAAMAAALEPSGTSAAGGAPRAVPASRGAAGPAAPARACGGPSPAWAPIEHWVNPGAEGLVPVSAWLMVRADRRSYECVPDVVQW
jgi:hypothetical protein